MRRCSSGPGQRTGWGQGQPEKPPGRPLGAPPLLSLLASRGHGCRRTRQNHGPVRERQRKRLRRHSWARAPGELGNQSCPGPGLGCDTVSDKDGVGSGQVRDSEQTQLQSSLHKSISRCPPASGLPGGAAPDTRPPEPPDGRRHRDSRGSANGTYRAGVSLRSWAGLNRPPAGPSPGRPAWCPAVRPVAGVRGGGSGERASRRACSPAGRRRAQRAAGRGPGRRPSRSERRPLEPWRGAEAAGAPSCWPDRVPAPNTGQRSQSGFNENPQGPSRPGSPPTPAPPRGRVRGGGSVR